MIHRSPDPDIEVPRTDFPSYVLERAAELGDKPALIEGATGRTLTYVDLAAEVHGLAAGLAGRGFGRGDTLALFMPNLPEFAVALLGAAAAGGKCTTANPLSTGKELGRQCEDAGAGAIVTVPDLLEVAREAAYVGGVEEIVVVGGGEEGATPFAALIEAGGEAPALAIDPETDLAVLPYSSGTTGLPKGVMLTHRNLIVNVAQCDACQPLGPADTLIAALPLFHIYGMIVILAHGLRAGATVVTMSRFELGSFLELSERHGVTQSFVVPPIALALADSPLVDQHDLGALRQVMSAAAPLGPELQQRLAVRLDANVFQGYGMTEASPITHMERAGGEVRPGSIGQPAPSTECRIVDYESGADVAAGEPGELWVRGPQVMAGYLGRPEATAETVDSEGWLHTGDVAVRDADGFYFIVDRLKELIKFKGFQVAPAELEALLLEHPEVSDVAVIGIPDVEAGELPKAFVVGAGDGPGGEELIAWVAERVAPHKRIRAVERVERIPRSPSGKILRRLLRDGAQPPA